MNDHDRIIEALNAISNLAESCIELIELERNNDYDLYSMLKQISSKSHHKAVKLNEQDIQTQRLKNIS